MMMTTTTRRLFVLEFLSLVAMAKDVASFVPPLSFRIKSPIAARLPLQTPRPSSSSSLSIALDAQLVTDLSIAATLGFATDSIVELAFNATHLEWQRQEEFTGTVLYGAARSVSIAARTYGVFLLTSLGLDKVNMMSSLPVYFHLPDRDAAWHIAVTLWIALTVSTVKRTLFQQSVHGERLGRVVFFDRLIDVVLTGVFAATVVDDLDIDVGMGLQSIFAASGVATLFFSLATKDLAEQIIGGFVIQAWDAFEIGDDIKLGDGTEGTVKQIGLVETQIQQYDNIMVQIPNSSLYKQRVSNLSRVKKSQFEQVLRFKYSDLPEVPAALADIKEEIRASCPKLITEGKPFRAVLTKYETDHVATVVLCHFDIPPGSAVSIWS
eukprot:scaffold2962_cov169-Amphora_coffeaeformis.AAC.8